MAIDRKSLVRRHNPRLNAFDPYGPLTIGNGEFAYTADVTGMQTFDGAYRQGQPLCTQSQWGWHTQPREGGVVWKRSDLRLEGFDIGGRTVGYATDATSQEEAFRWLRENPHRLHLGRIGLDLGPDARMQDLEQIDHGLDLWTGQMTSRFLWQNEPVEVLSVCHPDRDLLSFSLSSSLLGTGCVAVLLSFPYGSPTLSAADWESETLHTSTIVPDEAGVCRIHRKLDDDEYVVRLAPSPGAVCRRVGPHHFRIEAVKGQTSLALGVEFCKSGNAFSDIPAWETCLDASAEAWKSFWTGAAAVELVESRDPRAFELERRIILSQYLTAVQCSGSLPPQETGLSGNSWYGKFHLEMHWWHAAQFPLWGRPEKLERSLHWYRTRLPQARQRAADQGYKGARWPKMVGPDGEDSPSHIGPLLIWQQPHLIHLAELVQRARPQSPLEEFWDELIAETADFMVSFVRSEGGKGRLGPAVIPAQENHAPRTTVDPAFELAYWDYGLRQADSWFRRRQKEPDPSWVQTAEGLSPLPVSGGVYQAHAACSDTFEHFQTDHPSMLAALGFLPGNMADRPTMERTLDRVWSEWNWDEVWGWDFPLVAMTAARLGRPNQAVDALLHPSPKNTYSVNGHNRQGTVEALPLYLPGNGGLLAAIALMAGGWDGASGDSPGFPREDWAVRHEGLFRFP